MISCDPKALAAAAAGFRGILGGSVGKISVYLLCQWASQFGSNPPVVSDFALSEVAGAGVITVSVKAPSGITGFIGRLQTIPGIWENHFSVAPGSVTFTFVLVPGNTYEGQIAWSNDGVTPLSSWSPLKSFVAA